MARAYSTGVPHLDWIEEGPDHPKNGGSNRCGQSVQAADVSVDEGELQSCGVIERQAAAAPVKHGHRQDSGVT